MRYFITLFYIFLVVKSVSAQVQIVDIPIPGYEERITSYVNQIRIIDTHEHLISEEQRIESAEKMNQLKNYRLSLVEAI